MNCLRSAALLLGSATLVSNLLAQGSLTPPAAPAATFKTLQQVEPRIDLQADRMPAGVSTDDDHHFIINAAGSYYLSANLAVTKTNGIQILAAGVTLDLNGFETARSSGSGGIGIDIPPGSDRAHVHSGGIRGFQTGISASGPLGAITNSCLFRNLVVSDCTDTGIFAGRGALLEACRAVNNSGQVGLAAWSGTTFRDCTATRNTVVVPISGASGSTLINCNASDNTAAYFAISAGGRSALINCVASGNRGAGPETGGIRADLGSSVAHCSASNNQTDATKSFATGVGIRAFDNIRITDCVTEGNAGSGILVGSDCFVSRCTSAGNGSGAFGAGIRTTGGYNRIEENHLTSNGLYGIRSSSDMNVIVKNSAAQNGTANYEPASSPNMGPVSIASTATSPWANLQH